MSFNNVVLLLGSNLGETKNNLDEGIAKIEKYVGKIEKTSEMIETMPVEFVSINIFRNIALRLYTLHSPFKILKLIKFIENEMGRAQDSSVVGGYIDRVIDIDIVTYNNINFESKKLKIPHYKHLYEREFSKELLESLNKK